ncbi:ubiquinone/menaquinone biosynthesis C-methylase UbiE [Paenibacillus rhizosphaerae]|uniref:Ubiquinone/menaquinone biosynthesis C-methylase UbiE n=1 Tax=Paenibacillus rhizosphaerae TaxID=297318 RepID=A0A839TT46_9BACL|nr:methyltransferase domain-containing protein [Paenibacillus rhizosphaerae]MBB3128568.1 ubiquinone/menaquinone biosynthesis C-methylase UbiE [Paenibacillus rhizosphaerae]
MGSYDSYAKQYNDMVNSGGPEGSYRYILQQLHSLSDLADLKICDIGCGQGELAYRLSLLGAKVTGVDLSDKLLEYARNRTNQVSWVHDDAMSLKKLDDEAFDYVVSSVMLMDVPDHKRVYEAAYRILKPNGVMIWVIMHPCFQSPFSQPLGDGSRKIIQYDSQFWKSEGVGTIRSTLGAYHRPLSQYLNDFLTAGFSLIRVDELERDDNSVDKLPLMFAVIGKKKHLGQ